MPDLGRAFIQRNKLKMKDDSKTALLLATAEIFGGASDKQQSDFFNRLATIWNVQIQSASERNMQACYISEGLSREARLFILLLGTYCAEEHKN